MDRSFHSPLVDSKSPFSPRSRQSINTKRPFVPPSFRKTSRFSISGKSNQSVQVILKSSNNFVERFGQNLPVLVTEALTFTDKNAVVSARISESGYSWIVCGRRLLVWQYRQSQAEVGTPQKRTNTNRCFELPLPQSDLAHRAELVSVFASGSSQIPSCIAVSPEGVVRYWPLVTHEGVSIELIVDLQGQECDSLTDIGGVGCILATTTCSIVLVQPHLVGGRHQLSWRAIKSPTGWLGGISKRMSSFIFGPISTEQSPETNIVRVFSTQQSSCLWIVYIIAGHSLQKWRMQQNEPEQLIFVMELNRIIRDSFLLTVWENCSGDKANAETWLLDIQVVKEEVTILTAAVNLHMAPTIHYALVTVNTNTQQAPTSISDFSVLNLTGLYREDRLAEPLSYRFLLAGNSAYLYNRRSIMVVRQQEEPDTLEFTSSQDVLLGGSVCINTPIFFSRNHGLVTVTSNDLGPDLNMSLSLANATQEVSFNDSVTGNLTFYNIDADEIYRAFRDTLSQLKAAFIFHIKNQQAACQEIIQELFSSDSTRIPGVDASLDKVVLDICRELLDDYPASDPRWVNESSSTTSVGLGSSYSMQVLHQLNDKQHAYNLFIRFLRDTNLWSQLAAVTERRTVMATVHVLGELSEKLIASISLKNMGSNHVLESAIDKVISDDEVSVTQGLSKQDLFFREVTKVYRIFQEVANECEEIAHSDRNSNEIAAHIKSSNDLILLALKDVIQHRQRTVDNYKPNSNLSHLSCNYLPWTTALGDEGIGDSILLQEDLTYNYGAKLAGESVLQNNLYDQMVNLIDIILDGNKSHLESIKGSKQEEVLLKQYQTDRHKLISPLIIDKKFDRAVLLAEKYLDFEALVELCESTDNQQRLDDYMDKFNSVGFSEFVYTWYLQKNQPGKLIDRCRSTVKTKNTQHLTNFLADHPSLSWLQNIFDKKFSAAANILRDLAENEKDLVTRQKTMFSLCKLAKLASPDDDIEYIKYINSYLELIAFQENIPDYVLQNYGYDTKKLKVIAPKELIYLYTCEEYKEAGDLEFKKALDILEYINDNEEKNELLLYIWRTAILRDSWYNENLDSPMEILQTTLFFKLADMAICLGANPQSLLPPLDDLIENQKLAELRESKQFQYLIKTCYEYVQAL